MYTSLTPSPGPLGTCALALAVLAFSMPSHAELSANAAVTNNYIWRGLTQTTNEPAVQGGLDYSHASGFYAGTWVSNVQYDADDAYSYEHDVYFGFAADAGSFSYDIGYLYYNYDENAGYDFSEVYGAIAIGNLGLSVSLLAHAEPDAGPGQDFGFGEASYIAADYSFPLANEVVLGLHAGYHEGDFAESFNGVTESYTDYNISVSKDGFSFMVSDTNLDNLDDGAPIYASEPVRDNDEVKFVVSYAVDFDL